MKQTGFYLTILLALNLSLLGCGSGDGSDEPQVTPDPIPVKSPVASAGQNQSKKIGSVVKLDASTSSDPNGNQINYSWSITLQPENSQATLSNVNGVKPTFLADVAGTYGIQLIVNDGANNSVESILTITVTGLNENAIPVATAGENQNARVGATVYLDGSASLDADPKDELSYQWEAAFVPTGSRAVLSDSMAIKPSFEANVPGVYAFNLSVSDGKVTSSVSQVMIIVTEDNAQPVADAGAEQYVKIATDVTLDGSASRDANAGDTLTYQWIFIHKPDGSNVVSNSEKSLNPVFNFTADIAGEYVLSLVVNDGSVDSVTSNVTVTANSTFSKDAGVILNGDKPLMWQDDYSANNGNIPVEYWADATGYCEALNLAGYDNWRLPTKGELFDLVDVSYNPTVNPIFQNTAAWYWTSTPDPVDAGVSALVNFNIGKIDRTSTGNALAVRCVRYTQRYINSGSNIITDTDTGLIWQNEGYDGVVAMFYNVGSSSAVDFCATLTLGGFDDWRIPELDELLTIVDKSYSPAIDPIFEIGPSQTRWHWASDIVTPAYVDKNGNTINNAVVMGVYFESGVKTKLGAGNSNYVRCVR